MSTKIQVGGMSQDTTEKELQELFAKHGSVMSVAISLGSNLGDAKTTGLVEMEKAEEAQKAITILSGKDLGGRKLTVNQARPQQDRGSGRTAYQN